MKKFFGFLYFFIFMMLIGILATPCLACLIFIDFNNLENPNSTLVSSPYLEDGFSITGFPLLSFGQGDPRYAGSAGLLVASTAGQALLTRTRPFGLFSIELSFIEPIGTSPPITFTGNLSGGGSVMQTFQPISFGFTQFYFNSSFTDLVSISWLQGTDEFDGHQFDNIIIHDLPEPTTMLLLGTGLVGIVGAVRRRKRK